ncbi:MAG: cation:proton antiporter [Acidimicrobiales bacterium]
MVLVLAATGPAEVAPIVLIDIAVIIVVARLMGALFRRIGQPAVVGEILAGIMLGPSLLGAFPGDLPELLFPTEVRPFLKVVAELGLVIFMFIVGLELDTKLIRGKERLAAVISVSSVALPFVLGCLLAILLHRSHGVVDGEAVAFLPFALFIGASMSVTAFPVLARILTERGMHRTEVGALALACAAVDDILAWSLLAFVLAVVASSSPLDMPIILAESLIFVALMFKVVRPRLEQLVERYRKVGRLTPDILAVIVVGFLASSFITSNIGIHSIFGAFLFGVIMPREGTAELFHEILERLEQVSVLLLLPVFFIVTGLDANVRNLGISGAWQLGLILLVACSGKFLGAAIAARTQGVPRPKAAAIGVLMNTRGLTELVILNIGLSFGVLTPQLFTMLVIMAILTTIMTEPLLRLVYPPKAIARDVAEAERAALGLVDAYRVVVAVDDIGAADPLVDTAVAIVGDERPAEIVLTRFVRPAKTSELGSGLVTELAEVASSLDGLQRLAARAKAKGIPCVVRSQFSADITGDLLMQAVAVEANVLVVPSGTGPAGEAEATVDLDRLWHEPAATIAVLVDPRGAGLGVSAGRPVVVAGGSGTDPLVALELGARVAREASVELQVMPSAQRKAGRRIAAQVEHLRSAGLAPSAVTGEGGAAELAEHAAAAGLVVLGREGWEQDGRLAPETLELARGAGGPLLVVGSADGDDGEGVRRLVERLDAAGQDRTPEKEPAKVEVELQPPAGEAAR